MIESINWYGKTTQPILRKSSLSNSFKEIVYKIKKEYRKDNHFILVDHCDYRIYENKFKIFTSNEHVDYAYGIFVNISRSNLLLLDFDKKNEKEVSIALDFFLQCHQVCCIDLIKSNNTSPLPSWHMHIELYHKYNLLSFYSDLGLFNNLVCIGFLRAILSNQYAILRVSQKFLNGKSIEKTTPLVVKSFRKIDGVWNQYVPIRDKETKNHRFSLRG